MTQDSHRLALSSAAWSEVVWRLCFVITATTPRYLLTLEPSVFSCCYVMPGPLSTLHSASCPHSRVSFRTLANRLQNLEEQHEQGKHPRLE